MYVHVLSALSFEDTSFQRSSAVITTGSPTDGAAASTADGRGTVLSIAVMYGLAPAILSPWLVAVSQKPCSF